MGQNCFCTKSCWMKNHKVYIIGSGAIGKTLAVFLKQEGKEVVMVRGSVDNQPVSQNIISVRDQNNWIFTECITTTTFSNLQEINGVILITAKTFANADIAEKLTGIPGDFSIVLLQNGLNIEKPFEVFKNVYRGVLFSTSQIMDNGEVRFKTVSASPIGNSNGETHALEQLIEYINKCLIYHFLRGSSVKK